LGTLAVLGLCALAGRAAAVVTAADGYAVYTIPVGGTVQGGVVREGDVLLVGRGSFGAGMQEVVRLEGGVATPIATGFNSLAGFDLAPDGTLYVADNCYECSGATTGDTLYAIPHSLTRTMALAAEMAEVVPAGTIPSAQDVLVVSDGVLVGNPDCFGDGTVVKVSGGVASNLVTGLQCTAGLSVTGGGELLVGNLVLDPMTFVTLDAEVRRYTLAGASLGTLVSGLPGAYGQTIDGEGNVLVSVGFVLPGPSTVVAIDATPTVTERATGFVSSGDLFYDAARDETLVLDFGDTAITAICRDRDEDGICDADDACTEGVAVAKAKLTLKRLDTPPGDDKLKLKGRLALPTPFTPPLDPTANGVHVVVADTAGDIVDASIPGGTFDPATKTGWKVNKAGNVWSWSGPAGVAGITKVLVKVSAKTPGLVKFVVAGKDGSFATAPGNLPLAATFTLDSDGQCGEATFPGPLPAPSCAFNPKGSKVTCK
jgi:hypothetical protein